MPLIFDILLYSYACIASGNNVASHFMTFMRSTTHLLENLWWYLMKHMVSKKSVLSRLNVCRYGSRYSSFSRLHDAGAPLGL